MKKLAAGLALMGLALALYTGSGRQVMAATIPQFQAMSAKANPKVLFTAGFTGVEDWVTTPLNPDDIKDVTISLNIKHNVPVTLAITVSADSPSTIPTSAMNLQVGASSFTGGAGFGTDGSYLGTTGTGISTRGVDNRTDVFRLVVPYTMDPAVTYTTTLTYTITG
ncbi:MAG: hypothetical protein ACYC9Q_10075 [Bacillota bacterium]